MNTSLSVDEHKKSRLMPSKPFVRRKVIDVLMNVILARGFDIMADIDGIHRNDPPTDNRVLSCVLTDLRRLIRM